MLLLLALLGWSVLAHAGRVLRVGPGEALPVPSAAARIAQDGDTVEIAAGEYSGDVAVWPQHRLTLRGVGGRPHLRAAGRAAEGKAIWVIKGDEVLVENIEMSGTRVPGFAGAAIRAEGGRLTLRRVHFHDNEMGILTNNNGRGELAIIDSELDHNIVDFRRYGHLGHNIYVGRIASFELRGSYVHDAVIGHEVKTWARRNTIVGNRIVDGDGGSSYLIDLAEGGRVSRPGQPVAQERAGRQQRRHFLCAGGEQGCAGAARGDRQSVLGRGRPARRVRAQLLHGGGPRARQQRPRGRRDPIGAAGAHALSRRP